MNESRAETGPRAFTNESQAQHSTRALRNSKKSKDGLVSPETLTYYPPAWKDFLKDVKRDCWTVHTLGNPFPTKSRNLKASVSESLVTSVIEWTDRGTMFKAGGCYIVCTFQNLTFYRKLAR